MSHLFYQKECRGVIVFEMRRVLRPFFKKRNTPDNWSRGFWHPLFVINPFFSFGLPDTPTKDISLSLLLPIGMVGVFAALRVE
jgi:hypothetical protein